MIIQTGQAAPEAPEPAFALDILHRLPLADALLSLWSYVLQPSVLDDIFQRHRGRSFEDTLTFPVFVDLIADALLHHRGSGRQSTQRARAAGTLPTCPEAFYGKLRRVPLSLSLGFLEDVTTRLQPLLPQMLAATSLPASLDGLQVVVVDGKTLKKVAKRLLATRGVAGKVFGGKLLVAFMPARGLVLTMAADPDGEANDCRLVPALLPRARACLAGPRLWVFDRQFCDLVQTERCVQEGDHFLIRYHPKVHFHPDPEWPAQTSQDERGRTVVEEWGWLGEVNHPRRRSVRRITLVRPGDEDVLVVTDLLDASAYPAVDLLAVYLTRWGIERVFQQITEVFQLQRLIGSTPQATVFQAAFCLVLYNLIQVVRAYIAQVQPTPCPVESLSAEQIFYDVQQELTALSVLVQPAIVAACIPAERTLAEMVSHLQTLLGGVWTPRWLKAVNKKPRPKVKKAKCSGAHTSVHRLLEKHRQQQTTKRQP